MKNVLRLTWNRNVLDNENDFKKSADEIWGIWIDFVCYFDLYYDNWFRFLKNWDLLKDYDINWVWWSLWISMLQWFIYDRWHLKWQKIIDEQKMNHIWKDKFIQTIFAVNKKYNIPNTLFFIIDTNYTYKYVDIIEKKFSYPFIWKLYNVERWDWVFLIKTNYDLIEFISNNEWWWLLFQNMIENDWDYRVIVIWEKILWTIKRYNKDDYRNNVWKWWTTQIANISDNLKKISLEITKWFWLSISWIDYFIDKYWNYTIIEINDLPQYSWFEKTTWISYSIEVLKYFKNIA
jgi:hypothetical protein